MNRCNAWTYTKKIFQSVFHKFLYNTYSTTVLMVNINDKKRHTRRNVVKDQIMNIRIVILAMRMNETDVGLWIQKKEYTMLLH